MSSKELFGPSDSHLVQPAGGVSWSPGWKQDGIILFAVLLISRVIVLLALAKATGAREFTTDDVRLRKLSLNPTVLLRGEGDAEENTQYPPLMPMLGFIVAFPASKLLPTFFIMRVTYTLYELLVWPFFWLGVAAVRGASIWGRRLIGAIFILMPMGWITSVVMVQDEVIAGLFMTIVAWLVLTRRMNWAVFVCGLGVVSTKIFFLVPLLALVVGPPLRGIFRRLFLGALPVVVIYGIVIFIRHRMGRGPPLVDFAPEVPFGITFWTPLIEATHLSTKAARSISGFSALVCSVLLFITARGKQGIANPVRLLQVALGMLLIVFWIFYHIDPEYYFMVAPAILLAFPPVIGIVTTVGVHTLAWAINFFYGVANSMEMGVSNAFVNLYHLIFRNIPPRRLEHWTIALFVLANLAVILVVARCVTGRSESLPTAGSSGLASTPP